MNELTHEQKLLKAAELLTRKPAKLIEQILIKAMIGVVDGSVEAVQEAEAKIEKLEALNAELVVALKGLLDNGGDYTAKRDAARAAIAKWEGAK